MALRDDPPVLWVPRVLLAPLYLVEEYLLRRPLGAVISRANSLASARDDQTRGDKTVHVIAPTFFYDRGMDPQIGFYIANDRLFAAGNQLRFQVATWGPDASDLAVRDRYLIDADDAVQVRVAASRHVDEIFAGLGVTPQARDKFGLDRASADIAYRRRFIPDGWIEVGGGGHAAAIFNGYDDSYGAAVARASIVVDNRHERPASSTGAMVALHGEVDRGHGGTWAAYGGAIAGSVDLTGEHRVLTMELASEFVDGDAAPFVEYPIDPLPGFAPGYLRGPSTAAATLAYRWPVGAWLDARLRLAIGGAFGADLEGLSPSHLRVGGDAGLVVAHTENLAFELLVGAGTREDSAQITNVQITLGTRRAF